ncbi:MAG: winged helix-turn-helix transcriptional regulator [Spirochaetales bacterium]|nr:winged helix-turn-helix transcriptional regulator [Spirochaetales bacterium]
MTHEKELELLEKIYTNQDSVRQRDLARIVGLSLGMTNSIVKRLVKRGWLTVRKVNNRNIRYAVSPEGIDAITRKSYRYFKRTIRNVVYYREAISRIIKDAKERGYTGVIVIGTSDLDFIVQHFCAAHGMDYVKDEISYGGMIFHIYAESYITDPLIESNTHVLFLQSLMM